MHGVIASLQDLSQQGVRFEKVMNVPKFSTLLAMLVVLDKREPCLLLYAD